MTNPYKIVGDFSVIICPVFGSFIFFLRVVETRTSSLERGLYLPSEPRDDKSRLGKFASCVLEVLGKSWIRRSRPYGVWCDNPITNLP